MKKSKVFMGKNNITLLLQGKTLLKEIDSGAEQYRAWVEVSLQDELKPLYPFRVEANAMIGHSSYSNICHQSEAKFKIRTSHFFAEDIENDLEPSYEKVGVYINLDSIEELMTDLKDKNLELKDFVDAAKVDDYPL